MKKRLKTEKLRSVVAGFGVYKGVLVMVRRECTILEGWSQ